jgi:hypothetical protein
MGCEMVARWAISRFAAVATTGWKGWQLMQADDSAMVGINNEIDKIELRETLDGVAAKCKQDGSPLLPVLVRNPDGSIDPDDVRRWFGIRYGGQIPGDDGGDLADDAVAMWAEAETQACYEWRAQRP